MIDALGPGTILGYCTNVHAGTTLDGVLANLGRYAVAVKRLVSADAPMGVGLWLSDRAARQAVEQGRVGELREFLASRGLLAYTFNGFPFGDFHQRIVKHAVYEPDWTTQARSDYTLTLAKILAELLPDGGDSGGETSGGGTSGGGSISTLPIGWPSGDVATDRQRLAEAGRRLTDLVHQLARLELDTGRLIHINLEPEPGCLLDTAEDVVAFFKEHLLGGPDDESVLAYLRVCHDVCHSAVMFEPQRHALEIYRAAGIRVGKVQLSSAVAVDFEKLTPAQRRDALDQLRGFAEDRYLHQTAIRTSDGKTRLVEDLPAALGGGPGDQLSGAWRVHFHVPLFARSLGLLGTTQDDVVACMDLLRGSDTRHFEVETYAWNVLPAEHAPADLTEGIAREMAWVLDASRPARAAGGRG